MARVPYLQGLLPEDYLFWYSLDQPGQIAGSDASLVADELNEVNLTAEDPEPLWRLLRTGENYIDFLGTNLPLKSSTGKSLTIKHLFIIASFYGASFPNHAGLISERTGADGLLVGQQGTARFWDLSYTGLEYRKSGALFPQSNMQAPMNSIELLEWLLPSGYSADSIQIGRDREDAARKWSGRFYGAIGYDRVLSTLEVKKLRLYAQLKTRNWLTLGETLVFPAPELITGFSRYSRLYRVPLDFQSITDSHTYEDETKSFNQTNVKPPQRWEVEFNNLSWEKAQILDAFWENVRLIHKFNFYDYRKGEFYTGVRVENYERNHNAHESYKNSCRFILVKYGNEPSLPYELIDDVKPTVEILSPAAGAVLGGEVTITVNASDNIAVKRVEFYLAREVSPGVLENHQLGFSTVFPYSFTFDSAEYDDDDWTITAQAVDTSDNYSDPDQVVVSIDNTPVLDEEAPVLPDDALSLNGDPTVSTIPLIWLPATDNVGVTGYRLRYSKDAEFIVGVGTKTLGNVLVSTLTGLATDSEYFIYVQARDAAGNWSLASNVVTATTQADTGTPPIIGLMQDNIGLMQDNIVIMQD